MTIVMRSVDNYDHPASDPRKRRPRIPPDCRMIYPACGQLNQCCRARQAEYVQLYTVESTVRLAGLMCVFLASGAQNEVRKRTLAEPIASSEILPRAAAGLHFASERVLPCLFSRLLVPPVAP